MGFLPSLILLKLIKSFFYYYLVSKNIMHVKRYPFTDHTFSYLFSKHLAHMKEHLLSTKKLDIILTFST
jgi:hypothetical protein